MLLNEILQLMASGEDIEVNVLDECQTYDPNKQLLPKEWNEYEVKSIYSLWNPGTKTTFTCIEVRIIGED